MKQEIITILMVLGLMILLIWITLIIANRYFNKRMNSKSSKGIPDYTSSDVGGGFGGGD